MFEYPMEKYRFYSTTNKVVAVSTYGGKTVRGVAKCDPKDSFDYEKGRELAAARCGLKIAAKRTKRADNQLKKSVAAFAKAQKHMEDMNEYYEDARVSERNAKMKVDKILRTM